MSRKPGEKAALGSNPLAAMSFDRDVWAGENYNAGRHPRPTIGICIAMPHKQKKLKLVPHPAVGHVLEAPPALKASDHTVDYTCAGCGEVLLHAEEEQVHNLLIRCSKCGSYNSTDV